MQECLYEALAPYASKSVLQAIGEQHGLGFLMADGTLTVCLLYTSHLCGRAERCSRLHERL